MGWSGPIVAMWLTALAGQVSGPREYVPIRLPENAELLLQDFLKAPNDPLTAAIRKMVLEQAQTLRQKPRAELEKMLQEHLNNPALQDPAVAKLLDQFLDVRKEQPDLQGQRPAEALKEFNDKLLEDQRFSDEIVKRLAEKMPDDEGVKPPETAPPVQPRPPAAPPLALDPAGDAPLEDRFASWLADWIQDEATEGHLADLLRDSPDLQQALGDLTRSLRGAMGEGGWVPKMPAWAPPLGLDFSRPGLPFRIGELPRLSLPSMPELPQINLPFSPARAPGMPRFPSLSRPGMPSLSGASSDSRWLYLALAFILLLAGGWMLRRISWTTRSMTPPRTVTTLALPAKVTTRTQLRQVFEALALERWGEQARPWNHNLIARRWSEFPGQSTAAGELADLYELARYTPGDDQLSPEVQEQVRCTLTHLVGSPA